MDAVPESGCERAAGTDATRITNMTEQRPGNISLAFSRVPWPGALLNGRNEMGYWHELDAKRQAERDFERRHRPDHDMYDRYGRDSQRAYAEEYDRCRRQEERREEERLAELHEQHRLERQREEDRWRCEAEYYAELEAQEAAERLEAEEVAVPYSEREPQEELDEHHALDRG